MVLYNNERKLIDDMVQSIDLKYPLIKNTHKLFSFSVSNDRLIIH